MSIVRHPGSGRVGPDASGAGTREPTGASAWDCVRWHYFVGRFVELKADLALGDLAQRDVLEFQFFQRFDEWPGAGPELFDATGDQVDQDIGVRNNGAG